MAKDFFKLCARSLTRAFLLAFEANGEEDTIVQSSPFPTFYTTCSHVFIKQSVIVMDRVFIPTLPMR